MRKCRNWVAGIVALTASGSAAVAAEPLMVLDEVALDSVTAGLSNIRAEFSFDSFLVEGQSIGIQMLTQTTVVDQSLVAPGIFVPLRLTLARGNIFVQNQGTGFSAIDTALSFGVSLN